MAQEQALIESFRAVPGAERHCLRECSTETAYRDWKLRLAGERLEELRLKVEVLYEKIDRILKSRQAEEGFWLGESWKEEASYREMAEYYEKEIGYHIPPRTPFVGKNFNVTRAGIHADGLLKNEEIYNVFDTEKFLNRSAEVAVSNTSEAAGIAHWIDTHYRLKGDKKVDKNSELVTMIKAWVDSQYEDGRVTVLSDKELEAVIAETCERLGITLK